MRPANSVLGNGIADLGIDSASAESLDTALSVSRGPISNQPTGQSEERQVHKILVPTDFSLGAVRAVEHAVSLARQQGASLTLFHVIDVNAPAAVNHVGAADDLMKRLWSEGFDRMAKLAWSLNGKVEAKTMVQEGLPWEEIATRSRDFDLVILGQNRKRKSRGLFSHHTAQRVIENAACPVMSVPAEA